MSKFNFKSIGDILKKFDYCPIGNSRVQEIALIEEGIIPEQKYRIALVNWRATAEALKSHYFQEEENNINIKREKIKLSQIKDQLKSIVKHRTELSLKLKENDQITVEDIKQDLKELDYQRKNLELDKDLILLKLKDLEISKNLHKSLVADAIDSLMFYQNKLTELEAGGLRPFEEANLDYQRLKVLKDLRAEKIARELGVEKGSIEWASKYGANISELYQSNSIPSCVNSSHFSLNNPVKDGLLTLIKREDVEAKINIMIATPKRRNDCLMASDLSMLIPPHSNTMIHEVIAGENITIDVARNTLVERAKQIGVEWIFFLDDDVVIKRNTLVELINAAKDNGIKVISGYYYQKIDDVKLPTWGHRHDDGRHEAIIHEEDKIRECNWVIPFGCMLIHMSVFDELEEPYFNILYNEDKSVTHVGEDCYFVRKCNEIGIKTYIHGSALCGHVDFKKDRIFWGDKVTSFVHKAEVSPNILNEE